MDKINVSSITQSLNTNDIIIHNLQNALESPEDYTVIIELLNNNNQLVEKHAEIMLYAMEIEKIFRMNFIRVKIVYND